MSQTTKPLDRSTYPPARTHTNTVTAENDDGCNLALIPVLGFQICDTTSENDSFLQFSNLKQCCCFFALYCIIFISEKIYILSKAETIIIIVIVILNYSK